MSRFYPYDWRHLDLDSLLMTNTALGLRNRPRGGASEMDFVIVKNVMAFRKIEGDSIDGDAIQVSYEERTRLFGMANSLSTPPRRMPTARPFDSSLVIPHAEPGETILIAQFGATRTLRRFQTDAPPSDIAALLAALTVLSDRLEHRKYKATP